MAACVSCRSASVLPNSLRVVERASISSSAAGKAERCGTDRRAENVQARHCGLEAFASLTEAVCQRHARILELQRRERMRRYDLDALDHMQPGRLCIDHEGGETSRTGRFAAAGEHDVMVGNAAVRHPG